MRTSGKFARKPHHSIKKHFRAHACDLQKCSLPRCYCTPREIPGNLTREQTPQFVLIAFDGEVNPHNYDFYNELFNNRTNPNGCPIRGTFYVSHEGEPGYDLVQNLYSMGHEIASHTISHANGSVKFTKTQWANDMQGEREILAKFAHVPEVDVTGFRAPHLSTDVNEAMFQALHDNKFVYEASLLSFPRNPPLWPSTLVRLRLFFFLERIMTCEQYAYRAQ